MGTEKILLLLCFSVLVYGYTPTFRNEATHPLKAPTQSTLGLQIDESIGRTKSNIPKQETFFSGGKHFEYMLLNDSSVLLTSLQNDSPSDPVSEQSSSHKHESILKSEHTYVVDESTIKQRVLLSSTPHPERITSMRSQVRLSDHSPVVLNESISAYRKNTSDCTVRNNNRTNDTNILRALIKLPQEPQLNFHKLPDISSTTKLYSKHVNNSAENFASFTSPLVVKATFSSENNDSVLRGENTNLNVQRQVYDYDDSFTKLLILNGILKPENTDNKHEKPPYKSTTLSSETSNANPSMEDINRIMDSSIASIIRNNTESRNGVPLRAVISQNSGVTLKSLIKDKPPAYGSESFDPAYSSTLKENKDRIKEEKNSTSVYMMNEFISISPKFSYSKPLMQESLQSTQNVEPATKEQLNFILNVDELSSTKFTFTDFNPKENDSSFHTSKQKMVSSSNDSNSTQLDKISVVLEENSMKQQSHDDSMGFTQMYETTERNQVPSASAGSALTDISNENPLAAKTYTDSSAVDGSLNSTSPATVDHNNLTETEKQYSQSSTEDRTDLSATSFSTRNTVHQFFDENIMALTKFQSDSFHDVEKKDYRSSERRLFTNSKAAAILQNDFLNLTYTLVEILFYPVANLIRDNLLTQNESKVTVDYFSYINVTNILDEYLKSNASKKFERDTHRRAKESRSSKENPGKKYDWIDLNYFYEHTDFDTDFEYLFALQEEQNEGTALNDGHWFIWLSKNSSVVTQAWKDDFLKSLVNNSAIILHLDYCGFRIKTIFLLPTNLLTSANFPASLPAIHMEQELKIRVKDDIYPRGSKERSGGVLELLGQPFYIRQLFSFKRMGLKHPLSNPESMISKKHDDIELYIFVLLGAICTFSILSLVFYGVYRLLQNHSSKLFFKVPVIFRDRYLYHEKLPEGRSESLNVIFSENFDRKCSAISWLDNSHHSSSILQASSEIPSSIFVEKEGKFPDFGDITQNPVLNSPRLNKENKLNVLGCRTSCVLLPQSRTYLADGENNERFFDNPNYDENSR